MPNDNPILNNPYREPSLHYATNQDGEWDYQQIVKGRRLFSGTIQAIPVPRFKIRGYSPWASHPGIFSTPAFSGIAIFPRYSMP